jgi:hypothetical protein
MRGLNSPNSSWWRNVLTDRRVKRAKSPIFNISLLASVLLASNFGFVFAHNKPDDCALSWHDARQSVT